MKSDCIFCKIANKEIETAVVYEDEEIIAFKDIKAMAPVHFLFVPKRHIGTLNDISGQDAGLLGRLLAKIKELAMDSGIAEEGYRVVINCNKNAGQEVFHLHVHLLGGRKFSWPPG
ncbi:MAG: histidine triad nucleotide-binding protein [Candidatus Makaraimicrobium thalassicum]|nr:MAG: histidine triad nucleotide-binding protein [Candidatus Omnitrophota bacterium]